MTPTDAMRTCSRPSNEADAQPSRPKETITEKSPPVESVEVIAVFRPDLVDEILAKTVEAAVATAELHAIPGFAEQFEQAKVETGPGVSWRTLKLD